MVMSLPPIIYTRIKYDFLIAIYTTSMVLPSFQSLATRLSTFCSQQERDQMSSSRVFLTALVILFFFSTLRFDYSQCFNSGMKERRVLLTRSIPTLVEKSKKVYDVRSGNEKANKFWNMIKSKHRSEKISKSQNGSNRLIPGGPDPRHHQLTSIIRE